jgi:hypothetical protein
MTDDERNREGSEESIEDLEAPAAAQSDVAGGSGKLCGPKSCGNPSMVCYGPSCGAQTGINCTTLSKVIIVGGVA